MKLMKHAAAALCFGVLAASTPATFADETPSLGAIEAVRLATEAYIYGYPLVTFDMARRQQTNVAVPDAEHAPMGQMIKMRSYPAVDNHCCAAPNADTLYTEVWLDVSKEPWVVGIPEMGDRYYIVPFLDGWSEVVHVASTYATGRKAQTYAVTGPGWSGTLPKGVTEVKSPTGLVWVLGRVYSSGTPEDYKAVHALQDKFSVYPLSAWGKPYTPAAGIVDPGFDMKTSVRKLVNGLDAFDYFKHLAQLLKTNPPTPAAILGKIDMKKVKEDNGALSTVKNGPRLWTVDHIGAKVGKERDFQGLKARWVMWFPIPEAIVEGKDLSYSIMTAQRDTSMSVDKGSRVYILDDPQDTSFVMKSASLIKDPNQKFEDLKDLGSRLKLPAGWKFRTLILEQDLVFKTDNGKTNITQDDIGNTYDRTGGPYSNFKP